MKREFKAGDRIRYYGSFNDLLEVSKGTVLGVEQNGLLRIDLEYTAENKNNAVKIYAHPRQCKLLKPKQLRRVWIPKQWNQDSIDQIIKTKGLWLFDKPFATVKNNFIEFVQVKPEVKK